MRATAGIAARIARPTGWSAPPASARAPRAHRTASSVGGREMCGGFAGEGRASSTDTPPVAAAPVIVSREAARAATASEASVCPAKSAAARTPERMWSAPSRRRAVARPVRTPKSFAETGVVGQVPSRATGRAIALGAATAAGIPAAVRVAPCGRRLARLARGAPRSDLDLRRRTFAIQPTRHVHRVRTAR